MNVSFSPASADSSVSKPIRVMLVDDAVVVRGILGRWIESESDMHVVASLRNGREAVDQLEQVDPDVVILDIDMPELDGLSALPLLLAKRRHLVVIMASTLTRRNAEISLKALSLGAKDYIAKPESAGEVVGSQHFHHDLVEKIRHLCARARTRMLAQQASHRTSPATPAAAASPGAIASPPLAPDMPAALALRPFPPTIPRVLVVGASTGGPQALNQLVSHIGGLIDRAPVLITQHMPPTFTAIMAEHLQQASGRPAHEAKDGEEIVAGRIYIAPGGRHMAVTRRDGVAVIALTDTAPVNYCKPSVDPLFSSAAKIWGHWVSSLMLTGMGADGLTGAREIVAAGGSLIAQDEATSVVWGMPGQVAHAGICSAVLPLKDIAPRLMRLFGVDHS